MTERYRGELRKAIGRVRRRWWLSTALQGFARCATGVSVLVAGLLVNDRLFHPSDLSVLVILVALAAVGVGWAGWSLWPLVRVPTDRQVARFVEEQCPELEDALASAVGLDGAAAERAFGARLVADAAERIRRLDLDRVVSGRRLRRLAVQSAAAAVLLVGLASQAGGPVGRAARAARLYAFPVTVAIDVSPGDVRVPAGESVRVRARLRGIEPTDRVTVTLVYGSGEAWQRNEMIPGRDGFEGVVSNVTRPMRYHVVAGKAASAEYRIVPLVPPQVARVDVEYRYPPFTGLKPRIEIDSGDIYAPRGTRVTLRVHTTKPVASGTLAFADGAEQPLARSADRLLQGELTVQADRSYRVALADADGLRTSGDTEYFIRVMDDRPPDVRILRPAADRQITPLEEVLIEVRADDDHGVASVELVYAVRGGRERVVSLGPTQEAPTVSGAFTLAAEDLGLQPGDFVTYYARARDVGRGKRSSEARSDIFFLEVRPFGEAFAAAPSQAMGGGGGGGLDDLVAAQKEIIVATWKLDRRSTGGRSEDDIRTLARAQGELKARAQRVLRPRLSLRDARPRPGLLPGPVAEDDAVLLALGAMDRAERALGALQPRAALPHELEALNQLLRAAAELERRQVARQQGGGGGRARQDLSALFDRELQRQQQTNYETPAREPRREETESEALARLRELARRQDELAREQRDLLARSAARDVETLRRELERLTREQAQLAQQAEALARDLAERTGQRRSPGGRDEAGAAAARAEAERLRQASAAMRGAAGDLERHDLGRAAERSGRAAEQLFEAERRLRRTDPGERRRLLGDLQLESRQLAEAGRRLADEARRIAEGPRGADARRRVASESERLADRVDQLAAGLAALGSTARGPERTAIDGSTAELARQRLSRRLREAAGALRDSSSDAGASRRAAADMVARGEQTARSLDRIAVELGAALGTRNRDTARLADELARAAELAARLDEIERRLGEIARADPAPSPSRASNETSTESRRTGAADPRRSGTASADSSGGTDSSRDRARARLWEEYWSELGRARSLIEQLRRENPDLPVPMPGVDGPDPTWSAPGTEAFKQDFARWELLRRGVRLALERFQTSRSARLAEEALKDRLDAGASEQLPEEYRRLVERYYQTLAARKRP